MASPPHRIQVRLCDCDLFILKSTIYSCLRFLTDPTVSPEQRSMLKDPDTRKLFNIKTDPEIRDTLASLLDQVGAPVQVVFNTSVCLDCGVEGDSRLLPRHCHMEPQA